ncbi:MAG: ABC transporter permease [Candidatus Pacebacteria bacterium]|nr:ABC transporter permease [Candidatus Paceibacterota bacterium]
MFNNKLKRIFNIGFTNFKRGGTVSFASVLLVMITLVLVGLLLMFQVVLATLINTAKDRVDLVVYFSPSTSEEKILDLKTILEGRDDIKEVTYTTRESVLAQFEKKHENDYITLQALNELKNNPLGAELEVKAVDSSYYETINNYLKSDEIEGQGYGNEIDKINYYQNKEIIDSLIQKTESSRKFGIVLVLIFALIAIIITYNTIRLTIFVAREEITVMRLVGAENSYIRGPFILEGMMVGAIGTILAYLLMFVMLLSSRSGMTAFLGFDMFTYYLKNSFQIFFILLLIGLVVTAISSTIAIRKYLKK